MQPYCLGRYVVTIVAQCVPLNVPFHLESGCPGNCVFLQICYFYNFMLLSLTNIVFLAIMFLRFCQNKTYMYIYSILILNDSLLYDRVWGAACTRLSKFILIHQYLFLCMFLDSFFFSHRKGNYQQMWQQKRTSLRSITCMQQWRLVYKTGSYKCWL